MEYAGDTQYAGFLEKEYEQLKEDINRYAWDGKWYARALSSKGNVGTQDSAGSKSLFERTNMGCTGRSRGQRKAGLRVGSCGQHGAGFWLPLKSAAVPGV